MGSKALVRLVIVLAVVGAIALIVKFTGPGTVESVSGSGVSREKVFPEFPENFAKVRIKSADNEVNLVRGAKNWEVAERGSHPADTKAIVDFVRKIWDLDVLQAPEIGPSQFATLALTDPAKEAAGETATVVSFLNAEGKELESIWLGKIYEIADSRPSPFGGSGTTEAGRYVKPGGEEVVFLVGEPFSNIEPDPAEWLSEDFFKIEKLKSISIKSKPREDEGDTWTEADNWKLSREEVTGEFTLADAGPDEELDNVKVSSMKSAFSSPKFEDVVGGDEAKENTPDQATFEIETFDGFKYTVTAGKKNDLNELYLTYEVEGTFDESRKPGEEESDEEKEKLDQAFADSLKTLQDKLADEQAIAGKIYKVRSFVVDSITKKRSELLKGEEETPEGAGPGGPGIPGLPPGISLPQGFSMPPAAAPSPGKSKAAESPGKAKAKESPGKAKANESPGKAKAVETPGKAKAKESPGKAKAKESPGKAKAKESPGKAKAKESPGKAKAVESPGKSKAEPKPKPDPGADATGEPNATKPENGETPPAKPAEGEGS